MRDRRSGSGDRGKTGGIGQKGPKVETGPSGRFGSPPPQLLGLLGGSEEFVEVGLRGISLAARRQSYAALSVREIKLRKRT